MTVSSKRFIVACKRKVSYLLRKIRLLQFANTVMFVGNLLKNRKSNQLFLDENPGFPTPPAYLAYDAYNHTNWQYYYDSGLIHSSLIADLISEHVHKKEIKICEWGCGPARVIRHLVNMEGFEKIELFGTDFNKDSINWCEQNIRNVSFLKNELEPPLPFGDATFDCVYAISIFTHLSEKMNYAWIKELFRIIKPGGILIFTTHGNIYAKQLLTADKTRYDSGLLVTKAMVKEGTKLYTTYHPPQFIKMDLLKDHDVVKHINNPESYLLEQDVWVARKC